MKKILFFSLMSFFSLIGITNAQTVSGTIVDLGSNKIGVYGKPSSDLPSVLFDNIVFCVSIADQGGSNPTAAQLTVSSSIPNLSLEPTITLVENGRAYYCFNMTDNSTNVVSNWTVTGDNKVAEVTFPSNSFFNTMRLEDVTDGGSNGFMSWYVQITSLGQVSPTGNLFFGTGDNPPTNVASGTSFVPLQQTTVLPVKFTSFTAALNFADVLLDWQVSGETAATDHYTIERSYNGRDFTAVTNVAKSATAIATGKQYHSIDAGITNRVAANSIVYYRIKEVLHNGRYYYSDIRNVRLGNNPGFAVNVFPNPTHDIAVMNINLLSAGEIMVYMTDAAGRQVQSFIMTGVAGGNTKQMNLQGLQSGTYFIKVVSGKETKVSKIIID